MSKHNIIHVVTSIYSQMLVIHIEIESNSIPAPCCPPQALHALDGMRSLLTRDQPVFVCAKPNFLKNK